jgi:SMI1/KNR4 family protein SUKH-1
VGWERDEYLEDAVRDVLTADDARVDTTVGFAALLLASAGAIAESDRLVEKWHALTERPVTQLAADAVKARAWAMLFEARGERPKWAAALTPLDLDAEERAHLTYLNRADAMVPTGIFGDSPAAKIVSGLADKLDSAPRTDKVRTAAAEAETQAREGKRPQLDVWAELAVARTLPDVVSLIACRHVAPLLVAGADPLGIHDWAGRCAGDLTAALYRRFPAPPPETWPELVAEIMRLRGGDVPAPALPGAITEAERRLGTRLPQDYRDFLSTCDGLPADEVFPRLLGAAELVPAEAGVVLISERSEHGVLALSPLDNGWLALELDPVLGTTPHRSFKTLLEHHLDLLAK